MRLALALLLFGMAGCNSSPPVESTPPPSPPPSASRTPPARLALQDVASLKGHTSLIRDRLIPAQEFVRKLPKKADAWVTLGRLWTQLARETADPGFFLNAKDCADAALALEATNGLALGLLGQVHLNGHAFSDALAAADRALVIDPADLAALSVRSDAAIELGRFDDALSATQSMMDLKPNLASYTRTSYLRWLKGDGVGAKEAARHAIASGRSSQDPEPHAWVVVQAAMLFWHEGDYAGADAGFDMALASFTDYPPAFVGKGRVALARGDGAAAVAWFEKAFRKSPLVETAWLLGDAKQLAGDTAGAEAAYAIVKRRGRLDDPRTLSLFLATKNRDTDDALRLARSERGRRGDIYTLDALGFALYRARQFEEARTHLDAAARLGTRDASLLFHRGALLIAQGDKDGGAALLRDALKLNPAFNVDGAREARELLTQ